MLTITQKTERFTVEEYLKMDRAGVFDLLRYPRVELISGKIYSMSPQASPHRWACTKITRAFMTRFLDDAFWVVTQGTYFADKYGAPEPDLHVLNVPVGTPENKLPKPFIVVEASGTTYRRDVGVKLRQYAAVGVADYWVVNIKASRVEIYRDPHNPGRLRSQWVYRDVSHHSRGETIGLLAYPEITFNVDELLPV